MATNTVEILQAFEPDTLKVLAARQKITVAVEEEEEITKDLLIEALATNVEDKGIRELTKMMKKTQLEDVCDLADIEIDPKEVGNSKSKAVLTKRVFENISEAGLVNFVTECEDEELIKYLCGVCGINTTGYKMAKMQAKLIDHIDEFGREVFFSAFDVDVLQQACRDLRVKGWDKGSRKQLLNAILFNIPIPKKKKTVQKAKTTVPKKRAIHLCTDYQQLFQHYLTTELQEFCRKKGIKSSGSKKELINRILSFNDGDKENIMAAKKSTKKVTKKKAVLKTVEVEEEVEEQMEEEEDVESADEAEAEAEAEEDVESEDEDEDEAEEEEREDLSGCVIVLTGTHSRGRKELIDLIKNNGGTYKSTITKDTTHLVIADVNSTTQKANKARDQGVELVDDSFLLQFE